MLTKVKTQVENVVAEKSTVEAKLVEMENISEARGVEFEQLMATRLNETAIKIAAEKDEFYKLEIDKLETDHKAGLAAQFDQITEEKDKLSEQIDSLNQTVVSLNLELETKVTESNQTLVS